jgi:hypothetical protein
MESRSVFVNLVFRVLVKRLQERLSEIMSVIAEYLGENKMKLSIIPSEKYPHHEIEIQDWIAKAKGIYNRNRQLITIEKESEARIDKKGDPNKGAYYIKFKTGVQEEHWIPKSMCKIIERKETSLRAWGD